MGIPILLNTDIFLFKVPSCYHYLNSVVTKGPFPSNHGKYGSFTTFPAGNQFCDIGGGNTHLAIDQQ
jgi:hypothetical protein